MNLAKELIKGAAMLKKLSILIIIFSTLLIVGCKSAPVQNIDNATIVTNVDNASMTDIQKAIVRAGGGLGWIIKEKSPGKMVGTLHLRDHVAIVSITYSTKEYSINYMDSTNLNYDGSSIHSNYNGWIQNLNRAIQTQLNLL